MSIARLRNQLEALERKLALPLAVVRAKRVAQDICDHWAKAQAENKPLPTPFEVVQMAREAGIRYASFMDLNLYIQRCLKEKRSPEPEGFLHSVLPRASANGMVRAAMQRDSAFSDRTPRRAGEAHKPCTPPGWSPSLRRSPSIPPSSSGKPAPPSPVADAPGPGADTAAAES